MEDDTRQAASGRAAAAAGATVVVVLAIVELIVGEDAVLIPLLVLGPLMTVVSAQARATAAVGAWPACWPSRSARRTVASSTPGT